MHTLHCARNMVKCSECDMTVGKESMDIHIQEFHGLRICDQCQVSIEAFKLPEHKVRKTKMLTSLIDLRSGTNKFRISFDRFNVHFITY